MLARPTVVVSGSRSPRVLSNPLGLLGHAACKEEGSGRVGRCYNELECLAAGGRLAGYCAPAALGACCVFTTSDCGRVVSQEVSYFTNPAWPERDSRPMSCLLRVRPRPGVCNLRIDYEQLQIGSVNGKCAYDSGISM